MKKGKVIKVGVIGLGIMGNYHARILSALPRTKLAGLADIDFERAQSASQQYKAPAYDDYQKLLPEVEAIVLATPTKTHYKIGKSCLLAGKHLLIEKPFCGNSQEAKELTVLAKDKNLVLAVNLIERANPAFQKLRQLLKNEKIHGADFRRYSPYPERITDTNVIFDMMIHDLDLQNLILPQEIESIKASGEKTKSKNLDHVIVTITYKSGVISRIEGNRNFGVKTRKITVTTESRLIEADLLNKSVYIRDFSTPIPSTVPIRQTDQLTEILKNFISVIKGKSTPIASGKDGLQALSLAERIEKLC